MALPASPFLSERSTLALYLTTVGLILGFMSNRNRVQALFNQLVELLQQAGINLAGSFLKADAGFDGKTLLSTKDYPSQHPP